MIKKNRDSFEAHLIDKFGIKTIEKNDYDDAHASQHCSPHKVFSKDVESNLLPLPQEYFEIESCDFSTPIEHIFENIIKPTISDIFKNFNQNNTSQPEDKIEEFLGEFLHV